MRQKRCDKNGFRHSIIKSVIRKMIRTMRTHCLFFVHLIDHGLLFGAVVSFNCFAFPSQSGIGKCLIANRILHCRHECELENSLLKWSAVNLEQKFGEGNHHPFGLSHTRHTVFQFKRRSSKHNLRYDLISIAHANDWVRPHFQFVQCPKKCSIDLICV